MATNENNQHQPLSEQEPADLRYEPFLPTERTLILWSLGLGAALMLALAWVGYSYFPAG